MTPLLLLVYAGIAVSLGLLLTTPRANAFRIRAVLIVVLPALSFALWQATQPPHGWPTTAKQPADAGFLWGVIREPDPTVGDPGRIYLWLDVGAGKPRAYSLPYTRQLHQQVQTAINATRHNQQVGVRRSTGRRQRGPRGHSPHGSKMIFYREPPTVLPRKKR